MHVYLETERLILRRFTPDDVDLVTALDADPAVMRYINGGRPTPRDEIRDDYLPWWLAYYERGDRYGFWAAIERQTGAFLGWFHLRPLPDDPDDEPELGYRLTASAWGRGLSAKFPRYSSNSLFAAPPSSPMMSVMGVAFFADVTALTPHTTLVNRSVFPITL